MDNQINITPIGDILITTVKGLDQTPTNAVKISGNIENPRKFLAVQDKIQKDTYFMIESNKISLIINPNAPVGVGLRGWGFP